MSTLTRYNDLPLVDEIAMKPLDKFILLFSGRGDARGTGQGSVVREPLARQHFFQHLAGSPPGLGVFPVRDDATVSFAAVDIDRPRLDEAEAVARYLPGASWIERSRSGNFHVWTFFRDPVPAWVARGVLRKIVEGAGLPRETEVFPKQDRVPEGGVGNYINLPYHGQSRLVASGHDPCRYIESWQQFAHMAYDARVDTADWERRALRFGVRPPAERDDVEWGTGDFHECAAYIIARREENPLVSGHQNVVLFNVAKQLYHAASVDEAQAYEWLEQVCAAAEPPIPEKDLIRIVENVKRGQYTSTGCDDPLMAPYVDPACPIARGEV